MKKYTITKAKQMRGFTDTPIGKNAQFGSDAQEPHYLVPIEVNGPEEMQVSDGYHTMDELYDHRITLFIAFCKWFNIIDRAFPKVKIEPLLVKNHKTGMIENKAEIVRNPVWRSKLHSDGSEFECWFILGIGKEPGKQITYHLPISKWDETEFAETLENSPEWDGHSSVEVMERLKNL